MSQQVDCDLTKKAQRGASLGLDWCQDGAKLHCNVVYTSSILADKYC